MWMSFFGVGCFCAVCEVNLPTTFRKPRWVPDKWRWDSTAVSETSSIYSPFTSCKNPETKKTTFTSRQKAKLKTCEWLHRSCVTLKYLSWHYQNHNSFHKQLWHPVLCGMYSISGRFRIHLFFRVAGCQATGCNGDLILLFRPVTGTENRTTEPLKRYGCFGETKKRICAIITGIQWLNYWVYFLNNNVHNKSEWIHS